MKNNRALSFLVYGLAYFLVARVGIHIANLPPGNITVIWLPSGMGLVGFLLLGRIIFPVIWLASFLANFFSLWQGVNLQQAFIAGIWVSFLDASQSFLAFHVYRLGNLPDLLADGIRSIFRLVIVALVAVGCTAPLFVLGLEMTGFLKFNRFPEFVQLTSNLVFADILGILLVVPLYWAWQWRMLEKWGKREIVIFVLFNLLLYMVLVAGLVWQHLLLYLVLPVLMALAYYAGLGGVAAGTLAGSVIFIAFTAKGFGPFAAASAQQTFYELLMLLAMTSLPLYGLGIALHRLQESKENLAEKVKERTRELEEALHKIKTLHGIIPICSNCKRVRSDTGAWEQLELYIREHSDADFSHGICPDCAKKLYPQYRQDEES